MLFSSNLVLRFWREDSNMVEITKEILTFEKPSPLEESIQFKHILNAAKVITQVENITAHCERTPTIIHGLETTYT